MRRDYLDCIKRRRPAWAEEAGRLRRQARSISARIDAILWARDASFDLFSVTGPGQVLTIACNRLLQDFIVGGAQKVVMLIGLLVAVSALGINITPLAA